MKMKVENEFVPLEAPAAATKVLLHTCCAPCSVAIVESMLASAIEPTIYFYNPNIYPQEEYDKRKAEIIRYASNKGLPFIDADYNHADWLNQTKHLKDEPERGSRCQLCFSIRFKKSARYAHENGYKVFASTLGSSRWKDLIQINTAGHAAAALFSDLLFWDKNWKAGGLTNLQSKLVKENDFYRQQYCGCEFSIRKK